MEDSLLFLVYCCVKKGPRNGIRVWRVGRRMKTQQEERRRLAEALRMLVKDYARVRLALTALGEGGEDFYAFPS